MLKFTAADKSKRRNRRRNGKKESDDGDKKDDDAAQPPTSFSIGKIFGSTKAEPSTDEVGGTRRTPSHVLMVKTENVTHEPFENNDEIKVNMTVL